MVIWAWCWLPAPTPRRPGMTWCLGVRGEDRPHCPGLQMDPGWTGTSLALPAFSQGCRCVEMSMPSPAPPQLAGVMAASPRYAPVLCPALSPSLS